MNLKLFQKDPDLLPLVENVRYAVHNALSIPYEQNREFVCACRTVVELWEKVIRTMPTPVRYSNTEDLQHCKFCITDIEVYIQDRKRQRNGHEYNLVEMCLKSFMRHTVTEWGNWEVYGVPSDELKGSNRSHLRSNPFWTRN